MSGCALRNQTKSPSRLLFSLHSLAAVLSHQRSLTEESEAFGPLSFTEKHQSKHAQAEEFKMVHNGSCLLCDETFNLNDKEKFNVFLKHLLVHHKLVISDVKLIADIHRYVAYWKERFKAKPVEEFCTTIETNSLTSDKGDAEVYYLLADMLPEDKDLRIKLQRNKLDNVLSQQDQERKEEQFSRDCLFCRAHFDTNRMELFDHMNNEHGLCLGHPDNMVYTDEYLDVLQEKLDSCICLYCEKTFKDRHVLKEHMRKKNHKRINPHNTTYDKFYIINYLEIGKNWEAIHSENEEDDRLSTSSSVIDDWSDWRVDGSEFQAVCLYCDHRSEELEKALAHMKEVHRFDLHQLRIDLDLSFYQQVKLINYIRRQIYRQTCPYCQVRCICSAELQEHLQTSGHIGQVPARDEWDQPQYYFPTFENDNLLCALDDEDPDEPNDEAIDVENKQMARRSKDEAVAVKVNSDTHIKDDGKQKGVASTSVVIAEEVPLQDSVLQNKQVLADLKLN